nr:T9SS type A sorting domain-containing protein [Bacteroidota bacterium]
SLTDLEGNVILNMDNLENNTVYSNLMSLGLGCYKLRIDDSADDGLYWWHSSTQGTGYFRVKNSSGVIIENFEPEFGRFAIYEFGMVDFTGTGETPNQTNIVSIYPNPTSDVINIALKGFENQSIVATIFNNAMIKVMEDQFSIPGTDFTKSLNLKGLPAGMYMLRLAYDDEMVFRKVIKN